MKYEKGRDTIEFTLEFIEESHCTNVQVFYNGVKGVDYSICFNPSDLAKSFHKTLTREGYSKIEGVEDVK